MKVTQVTNLSHIFTLPLSPHQNESSHGETCRQWTPKEI